MKTITRSVFVNVLLVGLVLALGGTGCRKKPVGITAIPGTKPKIIGGDKLSGELGGGGIASGNTGGNTTTPVGEPIPVPPPGTAIALGGPDDYEGMAQDAAMFKANTVLFDLDSATIKSNQREKIQEVASYLKSSSSSGQKMLIDGHCDERGTEEYNRALGERRALAVREFLVRSGVAADRVFTRSWGEDRPSMQGHDEAAWSKNRRGEFILLKPKQ